MFFLVDAPVLRWTADVPTSTWRIVPAGAGAAERAAPEGARVGPTRPVRLRPVLTLPTWEDEIVAYTLGVAEGPYSPSPLLESYRNVSKAWRDQVDDALGSVDHRIGGWPNPLQAPVFDRVDRDSAPYRRFSTNGSAWRLLLQLDTDDDLGWEWGDTGRLYFAIGEARLRAGEFAATWLEMQCT
ncbi:DUF1963 domain-containing protein [Saccharomonospora azurea]|uniref:DUF1963 domain-containing protein n=1 Tax=Saccharomonospora azurea TaxID=40988 RepID=UPI003D8F46C6